MLGDFLGVEHEHGGGVGEFEHGGADVVVGDGREFGDLGGVRGEGGEGREAGLHWR